MRTYDPAELSHLQTSAQTRARLLLWLQPRVRSTGLVTSIGLWTGDDDQDFLISGTSRTYLAGVFLGMDDLTVEVGLSVRTTSVYLAAAATDLIGLTRNYDLRLARAEVHRVLTDPDTHQAVAAPHRLWKGMVDGAPITRAAIDADGSQTVLTLASAAMALTRTLTGKYSDEAMRLRGGDDRMFRYADVSGKVPVFWGEKHGRKPREDGERNRKRMRVARGWLK